MIEMYEARSSIQAVHVPEDLIAFDEVVISISLLER
jgi:hypothetical protein